MKTSVFHIKNMVCDRCIRVVREEMENLGLSVVDIHLGRLVILEPAKGFPLERMESVLKQNGFELLVEKNAQLVEDIKTLLIELCQGRELEFMNTNLSDYISGKLGRDYAYLSNLFSSVESITIEKYFILQKIEKVKELLIYNELSLSEIAYRLGYSSVQHLSSQFKKITGMTPSYFKKSKKLDRESLDQVGQ
ncbi:MAG: helix-turn-helix domain-containing protein [Fidelibacterota bacterium]